MSGIQASQNPPAGSSNLQLVKGICIPCVGPQGSSTPYAVQNIHSPEKVSVCVISLFPWVTIQEYNSQHDHLPSFPTWFHVDFSCSRLYKSLLASFQLVFSEHCFTYRHIFYVFVRGSDFHISTWSILVDLPTVFAFENKSENF